MIREREEREEREKMIRERREIEKMIRERREMENMIRERERMEKTIREREEREEREEIEERERMEKTIREREEIEERGKTIREREREVREKITLLHNNQIDYEYENIKIINERKMKDILEKDEIETIKKILDNVLVKKDKWEKRKKMSDIKHNPSNISTVPINIDELNEHSKLLTENVNEVDNKEHIITIKDYKDIPDYDAKYKKNEMKLNEDIKKHWNKFKSYKWYILGFAFVLFLNM